MWPFKKKTRADQVIAILDEAIELTSSKWIFFTKTLVFKDDVPLDGRVDAFLPPILQGLKTSFPQLAGSPDAILMLIVAKGIQKSGTHTKEEIEAAFGAPLPD